MTVTLKTGAFNGPALRIGGAVDLWCCHYLEIADQDVLQTYASLLSPQERAQRDRFHFERDRLRYLVTRALVRTTLARYCEENPNSLSFSVNEYGCPRLTDFSAKLSFNLSHTHGLIVLAVSSRSVGVDTENIEDRQAPIDEATGFFAAAEVSELQSVTPAVRQQRFYEYWTLKESYIKARGMGLSIPLDKFSFFLGSPGKIRLTVDPALGDSAQNWMFLLFKLEEFFIALCARGVALATDAVYARRVVPLIEERSIGLTAIRRS